ncbi:MAG: GTP cyclohydrolase I FolE [Gemmatimonadales bacterium]|nr:GTP cyclohydrolase I FolE [Candidatus Palauibacter irciniicola]MYC18123.1 GTP cyclohydrolase I FolE [Gemmatimonadales bacterium]
MAPPLGRCSEASWCRRSPRATGALRSACATGVCREPEAALTFTQTDARPYFLSQQLPIESPIRRRTSCPAGTAETDGRGRTVLRRASRNPLASDSTEGVTHGSPLLHPGRGAAAPRIRPRHPGTLLEEPVSEERLSRLVREQLELIGEDPDREGLVRTPARVASALEFLTRGYGQTVEEVIGTAIFEEPHDSMVIVKDIEVYSLCEHHMLPFFGKAHIAYIPNGRIVGISKFPRIVDVFARRLQLQERLTEQIAQAIEDALNPQGVGVVVEAIHLCMMMRGVEKQNSKTITSAVRGLFRRDHRTREEFLRLTRSD